MKTTLFTILSIFIISFTGQSQTVAEILKNNVSKTCDCIGKLDYIDSEVDLIFKFDKCSELSKNDSIILKNKSNLKKYKKLFRNEVSSCTAIKTKVKELKKRYSFSLEDSGDLANTNYQEIEKKIVGQYSLSFGNRNPSGGAKLYIYNKNKYVILSFGELQVGTWKVIRKKYLHLIPYRKKHLFSIYGRSNSEIGDSTKTVFRGGRFSHRTLIHYGEIKKDTQAFTPIFNKGANCFKFPYKGKIKNTYDLISLAYNKRESSKVTVFTFNNKQKFNDFVIYENIKMNGRKQIRVIIDEGKLIFGKNKITKRSDLPKETTEDGKFLKQITQSNYTEIPTNVYYNLGYKEFDSKVIQSEFYNFDKGLNSYISIKKCFGEGCPKEDDYDYSLRVKKYELLQDVKLYEKQILIKDNSIIYSKCNR